MVSPTTPVGRADRDRQITIALLKHYYKQFEESSTAWSNVEGLAAELGFEQNDIDYIWQRMGKDGLLQMDSHGYMANISAEGIEELHAHDHPTLLADQTRYALLKLLYEEDRKSGGGAYVGREGLASALGVSQEVVDRNVMYLDSKGLVDTEQGSYYVRTTDAGAKAYEDYEQTGAEIPGSTAVRDFKQVTIRAGEQQRALNLLRDFTEYAGKEIILIDNFAKKGIFPMIAHVDPVINIRILTTDRAGIDAAYQQLVVEEKNKRTFEVRYLPGNRAEKIFHDRYMIRDAKEGWEWGASFHDSGATQHTPSELKPVNLRTILADFESAWARAKVVE